MDISSILAAIAADAERGDIVFPTHTDIALRVQRMLEDPDCAIDALGKLIAAEPILAARVIGLARIFHRRGRRNSRKARYYWCSRQF